MAELWGTGCLDDDEVWAMVSGAPGIAESRRAHLGACDACRCVVAAAARRSAAEANTVPGAPHARTPRGAAIGRYELIHELGRGGMGEVYEAYDPQLDRRIALKLVRVADRGTGPASHRLVREAQAMARVQHANVLAVHDAGTIDGEVFIAMELVDGGTLAAWLAEAPRSWREIVARFALAGRGLAAAHAAGLVHRDFKPDNVLVGRDGRVRVGDFGLAGELAPGTVAGTFAYMAPEQLRGEPADARSDQFAFCVALHAAIAGAPPFSITPTRLAAIAAGPRTPRRLSRGALAVLRVVRRGLAAAPGARWPSMNALLAALEPAAPDRRVIAIGAIVIGAIIGLSRSEPPPPTARSVQRLTFAPGCQEYPAFLPAADALVFDADVDGAQQLFRLALADGTPRALTAGPGSRRGALVSPDGRRVAYEYQHAGPRELRVRSLDDEAADERTIGPGHILASAWLDARDFAVAAPDGTIAAIDVDHPDAPPRPIYADPAHRGFGYLAAFPDGALAVSWWSPPNQIAIGVIERGALRVLADHVPYTDGQLQVAPGGDAVYFVRRPGATSELVRVPRGGGEPRVVIGGVAPARGFTLSRDARLVFSTCTSHAQLVRIARDCAVTPVEGVAPWSDMVVAPIDADHVVVLSGRAGRDQLYVVDRSGAARAVTGRGVDVSSGAVSPDGGWLVYATHEPPGLWLAPLDGHQPARRLTDAADAFPRFTRDGAAIVFERAGGVWRIARAGGSALPIATHGNEIVPSPVDDRVAFLAHDASTSRLRLFIGTPQDVRAVGPPLPPGNAWSASMSPDGRRVTVVHEGHDLVELATDGAAPPRVRCTIRPWIQSAVDAGDGALFASVEALAGELWLADGEFQ